MSSTPPSSDRPGEAPRYPGTGPDRPSGGAIQPGAPVATTATAGGGLIETAGIEIIGESERTAKPRDLFWP